MSRAVGEGVRVSRSGELVTVNITLDLDGAEWLVGEFYHKSDGVYRDIVRGLNDAIYSIYMDGLYEEELNQLEME